MLLIIGYLFYNWFEAKRSWVSFKFFWFFLHGNFLEFQCFKHKSSRKFNISKKSPMTMIHEN